MMSSPLSRFFGATDHRFIQVRVMSGGLEVDSFQAQSSESLRAAIRPIYAHLPLLDASVHFEAVESEVGLLGARGASTSADLTNLTAALRFLGAQPDLDLSAESPTEPATREKAKVH